MHNICGIHVCLCFARVHLCKHHWVENLFSVLNLTRRLVMHFLRMFPWHSITGIKLHSIFEQNTCTQHVNYNMNSLKFVFFFLFVQKAQLCATIITFRLEANLFRIVANTHVNRVCFFPLFLCGINWIFNVRRENKAKIRHIIKRCLKNPLMRKVGECFRFLD